MDKDTKVSKVVDINSSEVDEETLKLMKRINQIDMGNGSLPTYNIIEDGTELEEKKIFKEERLVGFRLAARKYWMNYYTNMLLYTEKYDEVLEGLKNTRMELEDLTNSSKFIKTDILFITINPEQTIELSKFLKKVKTCVSKKWIDDYLYVIEQRGHNDDTCGSGFHCHMFICHKNNTKKWSDVKREIKSTFTSVCDISNPSCLKIKNVPTQLIYNNYLNYMIGLKKDDKGKNKRLKQEFDKVFRSKNGLLDVYTSNQQFFSNYIITCDNGASKVCKEVKEELASENGEVFDENINESGE